MCCTTTNATKHKSKHCLWQSFGAMGGKHTAVTQHVTSWQWFLSHSMP